MEANGCISVGDHPGFNDTEIGGGTSIFHSVDLSACGFLCIAPYFVLSSSTRSVGVE